MMRHRTSGARNDGFILLLLLFVLLLVLRRTASPLSSRPVA